MCRSSNEQRTVPYQLAAIFYTEENMKALYFIFWIVLSGTASAQNIPQLGSISDQLWAKSEELDIGKAVYDELLQRGNIYQSQADQDYLGYLGNKLGVYAPTRSGLRFFITNARSINAFASPGGYIGINAGLILATDNEHELAGVLAHEIAHVSQEHIARTVLSAKNRQVANLAAMAAGVLVATKGSSDAGIGAVSAIIANETQQQLNDIRAHEKEADKTGRRIMTQAGFSELGMQSFFGKLYVPGSAKGTPSYLLTHPLPLHRQASIDSLKKRSKRLRSSDEYYLFRARIRAKFLNKSELLQQIKQDRAANQAAIRDSAAYMNALQRMKYGQLSQAAAALNQMKTAMRNKRDVRLLKAKIALISGKPTAAKAIYRQLWRQYYGDSVVAYDYARYLVGQKDYPTAAKVLENQLDSNALNPQLFLLYGQILQRLGETVKQQRVLIRYYQQRGEYEKALAQAQVAAANPNMDWQNRAIFEAKEKELKRLVQQLKDN